MRIGRSGYAWPWAAKDIVVAATATATATSNSNTRDALMNPPVVASVELGTRAGSGREAQVATGQRLFAAAECFEQRGLPRLGPCIDRLGIQDIAQPRLALQQDARVRGVARNVDEFLRILVEIEQLGPPPHVMAILVATVAQHEPATRRANRVILTEYRARGRCAVGDVEQRVSRQRAERGSAGSIEYRGRAIDV